MKTAEFTNLMQQVKNGQMDLETAVQTENLTEKQRATLDALKPEQQQQPRKELTTEEVTDALQYLASTYKTTSAIKAAKEEICKVFNITAPCFVQVLKTWKITRINAAKDDNKNDKSVLRSFENTLRIVVGDMLTNEKYSKTLRSLLNEYENNMLGIFEKYCRNYNEGQFLTIKTRYNFEKGVIIKRYEVDDNLTSAKVFSLLAGVLDEIKRCRIDVVKGKERYIYKYVYGEIYAAGKFAEPYDGQNRPKIGDLITDDKIIAAAIDGSILWSERE